MLDAIQNAAIEMFLNAPSVLCQGGTAFADGWAGLTRARTKTVYDNTGVVIPTLKGPRADYINLFDRPYTKSSEEERPGIYIGADAHEATDRQVRKNASSGHHIEHRAMDLPIVIVVSHADIYTCRDMRNQLRFNVRQIILANIRKDTVWYQMLAPGESGGGELSEHNWMTDAGQNNTGKCNGYCVIPIRAEYQWTSVTSNA
jgi:hypothetical protein